jgi:zinc transporter
MTEGPITLSHELSLGGPTWVHLHANHPDTRAWLMENVADIDPFALEALLAEETRPRTVELTNQLLIILRGVNLNENANPEDMISIRILAGPDQIISIHKRELKAVLDLDNRIKAGSGPKNAGEFLYMLIARLSERMEPVVGHLDEGTDDIEAGLIDATTSQMRESIVEIRRRTIILRRYMAPQRDAISQLRSLDFNWLDANHKRHFVENLDRVTRYIEELDAIRERAQICRDEYASNLADKLNRNTYLLTVVAAIFLPLGFLTGLLGINLEGIPGADNPLSFWIFCGFLVMLVIGSVLIFKRFKLL